MGYMAIVHTLRLKHYVDAFTITSSSASLSLSIALSAYTKDSLAIGSRSLSFSLVKHCPADISCWNLCSTPAMVVVMVMPFERSESADEYEGGRVGESKGRPNKKEKRLTTIHTVAKVALKFIKLFRSSSLVRSFLNCYCCCNFCAREKKTKIYKRLREKCVGIIYQRGISSI